jgi:hypothetical protein
MAGVAGDDLAAREVALVDGGDHLHHPASGPFQVVVAGVFGPAPAAIDAAAVQFMPSAPEKNPIVPMN